MNILILGPNGSGKSAYAEEVAAKLSKGTLYYIATMIPYDAADQSRVEKHRKQREAKHFITTERPYTVSDIMLSQQASVLLEDASNLLSNVLFGSHHIGDADSVYADIMGLCAKCSTAVLVSIAGLTIEPDYNDETCDYVNALNRLNDRLACFADIVIRMQDGRPVFEKGDAHALS